MHENGATENAGMGKLALSWGGVENAGVEILHSSSVSVQ